MSRRGGVDVLRGRRSLLRLLGALPFAAGPLRALAAAGVVVDVRAHGARGDGRRDDTAALQAAIDALPPGGGTVLVPPGDYLVDPDRGIQLRSRMRLQLDPRASLVSMPTAAPRSFLVQARDVSDVEIVGGRVVGDRDHHLGSGGEWGHGIQLRGARRTTIRDIRVEKCWGDGISVGGLDRHIPGRPPEPSTGVLIQRVVGTGNRRQALTVGFSRGVRVLDCEFSDTGGTAPQAGIDVEADAPLGVSDVEIARCRIHGNRGPGIQLWHRTANVTIRDCTVEGNRNCGVLAAGTLNAAIVGNRIRGNGFAGVAVRKDSRGVTLRGNRFAGNMARMGGIGQAAMRLAGGRRNGQLEVGPDARDVRIAADNRFD